MNTIRVSASRAYDILMEQGLFGQAGMLIRSRLDAAKAMIVSDDIVYPLYGEQLRQELEDQGIDVQNYVIPHGERSKNLITYADILETLCAGNITRGDLVIALGGGVVGDLAGFAAATYQRGVGLVQIPTTLLACVDSSVGGKTAVNLSGGKNQAGCFYQPSLVLIDPILLTTLSETELRSGYAEVIKYAILGDRELFDDLLQLEPGVVTEDLIGACVHGKREIVERDEFDRADRRLLNFGHSFGHAVERCSNYAVPHGYAVAMGMATMTRAAETRGICSSETRERVEDILHRYELPTEIPFSAAEIADNLWADKKRNKRGLSLIVPERVGHCVIREIDLSEVGQWLADGGLR